VPEVQRPSKKQQELAGLVGEILAIVLGFVLIAVGWTGLGEILVAIGAIGFVISAVRLWRLVRRPT
jgi:predicted tellurium resistance membrane protein TerC